MSRNVKILAAAVFGGTCLAPVTAECVDVYNDRGDWEAAVSTIRLDEDFESETPGTYGTPYQTAGGFNVETPGMFIDLTVRDNGAVDNTRELLIQDYAERTFFTFPTNRRQLAFGFDWATGGEAWSLKFLGQEYVLPVGSSGFIGLVDADGASFGFELTSSATTQDGLAIDNLTFSPALFVFTSRVEWEGALGMSPSEGEGFESDTPGAYQTPYTTGGGCELQSMGSAIDLSVIDSGLVDGSRELHFSDYGEQLSVGFPGGKAQAGFGFDWNAPQETWSLIARDEYISLYGTGSGFVGVLDQTGQSQGFILTSLTVVQVGIHIDNLVFTEGTVPVRQATWGSIKARFEP